MLGKQATDEKLGFERSSSLASVWLIIRAVGFVTFGAITRNRWK